MLAAQFSLVRRSRPVVLSTRVVHRSVPIPQRHHALTLLAGTALIACVVASQEVQHTSADGREFRIYRIYLAGIPGKPVSINASVEHIESMDGTKVVSKHWVEEWIRDQEGRVWGRVRAPQEGHPGKLPPLATVWLYDAATERSTICSVADRECRVNEHHAPSTISFFKVGGSSTVCIDGVCQAPEPHERVLCGEERFKQTFLGEYSIGGINLGHTRIMCYKPDGSGAGVDLWHNSEFDIYFDVYNLPLRKGATYYRIDQISSSVPDDPKLFQLPPSGYSLQ